MFALSYFAGDKNTKTLHWFSLKNKNKFDICITRPPCIQTANYRAFLWESYIRKIRELWLFYITLIPGENEEGWGKKLTYDIACIRRFTNTNNKTPGFD